MSKKQLNGKTMCAYETKWKYNLGEIWKETFFACSVLLLESYVTVLTLYAEISNPPLWN